MISLLKVLLRVHIIAVSCVYCSYYVSIRLRRYCVYFSVYLVKCVGFMYGVKKIVIAVLLTITILV